MSNEQEWQRLQGLYAAMSDGELLRLAADKAALTEVAQQAIDAEVSKRGLEVPVEEEVEAVSAPEESEAGADPSLIELITFHIPMDADKAMRLLSEHNVPAYMEYAVRQVNEDGPKVKMNWLSIFVQRSRKEDAMSLLRKGMGLFPVLSADEVDDADGVLHLRTRAFQELSADEIDQADGDVEDEEAVYMVGNFEEAADVEVALKALTDAGIWFDAVKDETAEWPGTNIMVKRDDLERALEVVETAFDEADQ